MEFRKKVSAPVWVRCEVTLLDGTDVCVIERPSRSSSHVHVVPRSEVDTWPTCSADEFNVAADSMIAQRRRQSNVDRYAIRCRASRYYGEPWVVKIVRATRTLYIDASGKKWNRTGRSRGGERGTGRGCIDADDLAKLEEFLAGREVVDIVAERKAADEV